MSDKGLHSKSEVILFLNGQYALADKDSKTAKLLESTLFYVNEKPDVDAEVRVLNARIAKIEQDRNFYMSKAGALEDELKLVKDLIAIAKKMEAFARDY